MIVSSLSLYESVWDTHGIESELKRDNRHLERKERYCKERKLRVNTVTKLSVKS